MKPTTHFTDEWTDLCAIDEVPIGGGHYVVHEGRPVAVLRVADQTVRVMKDACPHAGGSLSAGYVDSESGCVICPWHAWPFDLETGTCPDNEAYQVRTYPARIVGGRVMAKMDRDPQVPPRG